MSDDTELTPYRIDVPQADLDDLRRRIGEARWPEATPGGGWEYGVEDGYLRELAAYWQDGFDWRAQEERLNAWPQFTTTVDGQHVHLAHVRSPEPDAVPLVITHGWPSTIADFLDVVGPLTDPKAHGAPDAPAFHVVAPSLPGFPFSGPTRDRGWDVTRVAKAWAELMRRLGYDRYVAQGGDYGSFVAPELGRADTEHVLGVHVNALASAALPDFTSENPFEGLTPEEVEQAQAFAAVWQQQRAGYATIQSTRPQTLAYSLLDAPVGLLAWNLEWFVDYDPTVTTQTPVPRDAYLTDVTAYWLTRTAGSAARSYKESGEYGTTKSVSGVPTAVAKFTGDAALRTLAERSHRIVRWTEYDTGGHFASLQAPDELVGDIRAFVADLDLDLDLT